MPLCTLKGCLQNPADYNSTITCTINVCGICRDPAGSEARKAVSSPVKFYRTNWAGPQHGPEQDNPGHLGLEAAGAGSLVMA